MLCFDCIDRGRLCSWEVFSCREAKVTNSKLAIARAGSFLTQQMQARGSYGI